VILSGCTRADAGGLSSTARPYRSAGIRTRAKHKSGSIDQHLVIKVEIRVRLRRAIRDIRDRPNAAALQIRIAQSGVSDFGYKSARADRNARRR
jgi:hypothetical protein